jgi:hypothetical protein
VQNGDQQKWTYTTEKKQKYSNMNKYPQEVRATGVDAVEGKLPTDGLFVKNEL